MNKRKRVSQTIKALSSLDFDMSHELMNIKKITIDTEFTISHLESTKARFDMKLRMAENNIAEYKNLPQTLSDQFALAKKRKMVIKGLMTKQQNKLRASIGLR